MKIISWNVNSLKMRLPILEKLVAEEKPDVILLQEVKCMTDAFPYLEVEGLGYNVAVHGQKTFNGVAILSRSPIEDVTKGIPGFEDEQARYIECFTNVGNIGVRVASVYVPNGQSVGSDKFEYKLKFMNALHSHMNNMLKYEEAYVVAGDINIAPEDIDVYDPKKMDGEIGFHIEERKALRGVFDLGFYDAFRIKHPEKQEFSWWDYRGRSLAANEGLRIDNILLSPEATDMLSDAHILKSYRMLEKTSDHAPISCELG